MTRVMIVDDEAPFRFLLKAMARATGCIEVVAEADTAEEALAKVADTKPALVFMDVRLPGMSGLQGAARIQEVDPEIRVVLMSAEDSPDYRAFATNGGAAGFMPKSDITPSVLHELAAECMLSSDGRPTEGRC